jgi:hypothetical protein
MDFAANAKRLEVCVGTFLFGVPSVSCGSVQIRPLTSVDLLVRVEVLRCAENGAKVLHHTNSNKHTHRG